MFRVFDISPSPSSLKKNRYLITIWRYGWTRQTKGIISNETLIDDQIIAP